MKRYFIYFTTTLTLTVFAHVQKGQSQTPAQQGQSQTPAQQGQSQTPAQQIQDDTSQDDLKADGKAKLKRKGSEEIIIKKTVIVIEDGKVTIDGKPSGDWNDGSVIIRQLNDIDDGQPFAFHFDFPYEQSVKKYKMLQDIYGQRRVRLGVYTKENEKGAEIIHVIDSSVAAKAGLEKGDIITKVGDAPIANPNMLNKVVTDLQPGDKVTIVYVRDGKEARTQVTMDKPKYMVWNDLVLRPDVHLKLKGLPGLGPRPRLGLHIQDTEDTSGVKVLQIDPESPAATAGVQKDDVITAIDGKKVANIDDAMDVLGDNEDKFSYPITVSRGGQSLTLQVKIPHELKSANL
jgi:serine protease Do